MFELRKEFEFAASHQLPYHDGKCRRLHGHNWVIVLTIQGKELIKDGPKRDMLIDYGDISRIVQSLLDNYLDHYHLNDSTGLENPTSEALAEWIYNRLDPLIRMLRRGEYQTDLVELASVKVEETCTCACTYYPERSFMVGEERAGSNPAHRTTVHSPGTIKGKRKL